MDVVVIIVNYNSGKLLVECLDALKKQTLAAKEVIIVDNNSTDNSLDNVSASALNLTLIKLDYNAGFAKANNIALDRVNAYHYVALLNPDAFPEPNWLQELVNCSLKYPQHSFFASNMLDAKNPNLIDGQGDIYHFSGLAWRNKHGQQLCLNDPENQHEHEIFAACAGAALYRTIDIKAIGGFDEDFFCYMEDVDLCFRLLLAGKKGVYAPKAIVKHIGSAITGKRSHFSIYYGHRNLVWTYFKNMPFSLLLLSLPVHLALNIFSLLFFTSKGQGRVILKAKYDALTGLTQQLKKRHRIQKNKKVSTGYLFSLMSKQLFHPRRIINKTKTKQ